MDVHISIWPVALFVGSLRAHTLIFLTEFFKGSTFCRPVLQEREVGRLLRKARRLQFVLHGGPFLTRRFFSLASQLLLNFLKSWVSQGLRWSASSARTWNTTLWPSDSRHLRTTQRTVSSWTSSSASSTSGLLLSPTSLGTTCFFL